MLLTIDIGNTNIVFALFDRDKLLFDDLRIETSRIHNEKDIAEFLEPIFKNEDISLKEVEDIIIASVAPRIDGFFRDWAKRIDKKPIFVNSDNANIKIKIDKPNGLGADRIAASIGAVKKYGNNLIVIDFGTATTFEVIDDQGSYVGGMISPGIKSCIKGLVSAAEKLNEYDFDKPKAGIPTNLQDALSAGIYYGYIGLVKEIITRLKKMYKMDLTVIATGGLGRQISGEIDLINFYDQNLVSYGLREIYKEICS